MKINFRQPRRFWRLFILGTVTLAIVIGANPAAKATRGAAQQQPSPATSGEQRSEGQRSGGSPQRLPFWKDPVVVKRLSLTQAQADKIDEIWHKREKEMRGPDAEWRKHRTELSRMMAERKVGLDVIAVQVDRVEAQRTTLEKSRMLMLYQFSLVLTPEQNKELEAYQAEQRNRRGRGDSRGQ